MTDDPDHADEPEPADGYPLREAPERFADPDKVRAYAEAERALQGYPAQRSSWLDRVPEDGWLSRWSRGDWLGERLPGARPRPRPYGHPSQSVSYGEARLRADRARQALRDDVRGRLLSGELVAWGYRSPATGFDDPPVPIPADRWPMVRIDFHRSTVEWSGLKLTDVRVARARPGAPGQVVPAAEPGSPAGNTTRKRRGGRPSIRAAVEAELERLAGRGELCPGQAEQFRRLEAWARAEQARGGLADHPPVPKARSLEKALARRYQELVAKKTCDK